MINLPTEAAWMIGYPAPDTFDEDSAAMSVINIVLGGGAWAAACSWRSVKTRLSLYGFSAR